MRLVEADPERMLPLLTTDAEPVLAYSRGYIAGVLSRAQDDGARLTALPELPAEVIARLGLSLLLTPASVLPLEDDEKLAAFARSVLGPMLFASVH